MSANEYLIDASTRHQIMLQRLSGGSFNKLKPLLEKLQKDIKARLANNPTDFQMHRLTALMRDIQALFDTANAEVSRQLNLDLNEFVPYETDFQYRMLGNAVTTELTLPAIEQVVSAVTTAKAELISGGVTKRLTISEMIETLGTKPATIENKIRAGIIEGKSVDQMVRDIVITSYSIHYTKLYEGKRVFAILDGKFIFGDFIEALIVKNNWLVEDLTISTLSMSQDNVDSLRNLLVGDYVMQMNIIISHYYFANERSGLMPYLYEKLDVDNKLQVDVASVHTKIAMIRTKCGKKITIHGSANMRTSSNIEQIVIEAGDDIYEFCYGIHASIVEMHKTINKPVRRNALWQAVLMAQEEVPDSLNTEQHEHQHSEETHKDKQQHRQQHKAGV